MVNIKKNIDINNNVLIYDVINVNFNKIVIFYKNVKKIIEIVIQDMDVEILIYYVYVVVSMCTPVDPFVTVVVFSVPRNASVSK